MTNNQLHLQTMIDKLTTKLTEKDAELIAITTKLTEKNAEFTEKITQLIKKSDRIDAKLTMWNTLNNTLTNVTNNQLHLQTNAEQLREMINELASKSEESFNRLKIQTRLSTTIIKLNNFHQHKINNDIIYSSPFYTSLKGYKLCLSFAVNGIGDGKGNHVSVYACLMKGEYDDSLTWPFLGTVTFELLNQLNVSQSVGVVITYHMSNDVK